MKFRLHPDNHPFPPAEIPGAEYDRYRLSASQTPELFTLTDRPVKDVKRQGAHYRQVINTSGEGYQGIAAFTHNGGIECWPYPASAATTPPPLIEDGRNLTVAGENPDKQSDYLDYFKEVLPEQMVQVRRWLVYKLVPNPVPGKKDRKVPYYVSGVAREGTLDTPEDTGRLAALADAIAALSSGEYAGIGFALGPDGSGNYWQGIDLDDLPLHPELHHLLDVLPSYTEQSPSGEGVHAIGYGKPFAALGSNKTGIEAYSAGRFFTVTGSGAGLHPLCDVSEFVQAELQPLHKRGNNDSSQPDAALEGVMHSRGIERHWAASGWQTR